MGYIYKITHKESKKSYIGQTTQDLDIRNLEVRSRFLILLQ